MAFPTRRKPTTQSTNLPSIHAIQIYLKKKGWICDYVWQGKIKYYLHDLHPTKELKLTVDKSIKDYDKRLATFFKDLSSIEDKSVEDLIDDILNSEKPSKVVEKVAEVSVGINPIKPLIHDENGKFIKGNKLAAIPHEIHMASIRKHRHLIADRADELIKRAIDLALTDDLSKTNVNCLMDLLKLYLPTPKPVTFIEAKINAAGLTTLAGVKEESINVIKQLEGGNNSAESIVAALEILHAHTKFIEMADIEPRMREIEQVINAQKARG